MMTRDNLVKEIDSIIPVVKMPSSDDLVMHGGDCYVCNDIRRYLDSMRDNSVTDDVIRYLHQELYHLSAAAFRWILPYYLKFSLSPEGEYSWSETNFLVYNLSPDPEFERETYIRLSELNSAQIKYLINYLEWVGDNENWYELRDRVEEAKNFLLRYQAI